jgi:hypothetical protein
MDLKLHLNFMIRQIIAGEVHGLNTLLLIKNDLSKKTPSRQLVKELDRQIQDESRHIALYKKLLLADRYRLPATDGAAAKWKSVLHFLGKPETSLPVRVAAVYGCLEQLNYYILEDHVLPHVQGEDLRLIKEVVADEESHLGMIDLYEEEIGPYISQEEKRNTLNFITTFAGFLRESVAFPDQSQMEFSNSSEKSMTRDLIDLRRRVKGWGSACRV